MTKPDSYRVLLAKRAADDLESIFNHIARESPQNAPEMIERILVSLENLFPHRTVVEGQKATIRHPVRSLPVKPYIIFFRVIDEQKAVRCCGSDMEHVEDQSDFRVSFVNANG